MILKMKAGDLDGSPDQSTGKSENQGYHFDIIYHGDRGVNVNDAVSIAVNKHPELYKDMCDKLSDDLEKMNEKIKLLFENEKTLTIF